MYNRVTMPGRGNDPSRKGSWRQKEKQRTCADGHERGRTSRLRAGGRGDGHLDIVDTKQVLHTRTEHVYFAARTMVATQKRHQRQVKMQVRVVRDEATVSSHERM